MKIKKSKKFAEEQEPTNDATTLNVHVLDENGEPVKEKEMTEEQVNFCAKVATKMFKKFSASKVKRFDAETEDIDVTLPEDVAEADIDQIVEDAAEARDEEASKDEVVVETEEEPEDNDDPESDPEDNDDPDEPEDEKSEVVEACKTFAAKLRRCKRFSSEDLEKLEDLQDQITEKVDDIKKEETLDPDNGPSAEGGEGVGDIKEFNAGRSNRQRNFNATGDVIEKMIGADNLDTYKAKFFAASRK